MKMILCALAFVSLAACSHSSSDDKKSGVLSDGNGSGSQEKMENMTDYSVCNYNGTPSSIVGTWQMTQKTKDFNFVMTITIGNGFVSLDNTCSFQGRYLDAYVTAPASFNASSLSISSAQVDNEKIDESDFKMNCSASLSAASINYSFQGSCLVLSAPGQDSMVLVPR